MRIAPWIPCLFFLTILFLGSLGLQAQSIDNVTVTGTPVCKPSSIDVSFRVTNGNGNKRYFTANTKYIIDLGTLSGNTFTIESTQSYTTPSNFPSGNNDAFTFITKSFSVPNNITNRPNYQVIISSTNPDAGFTFSSLSEVFEVRSTPATPAVGTITQPTCSSPTGSVSLSGLPETGNWVLTQFPGGTITTGTGTSTTIAGLAAGSYTYIVTNTNGCSSSPSENVIIDSQPLQISNNQLSFSNGISGTLCATANENEVVNLSAPAETIFNYVNFASYGTPSGSCGNFTIDSNCHALTSQAVTETNLLGNNTATIPATNTVFGDPCSGTFKSLYVQASYSQPICNGSDPGTISGTIPTGGDGNYTYLWESSITGPNSGFTPASGLNTTQNFNPGILIATTWFKRTVTSLDCSDESPVLLIQVKQDNIWTGVTNTDWNTASNWACNSIPNLDLNVIIPDGLTNYPILNIGDIGMAKDIQIETGATLIVLDTLQIAGTVTANNETINSKKGSVAFVGTTSAQIIPANIFLENRIRDLIINNIDGVSSLGELEITGFLRVNQNLSNFNTGDMLTLISDASQTALIDGSGNGQIVGSVKMQRFLDPAFGYKYFSSPFSDSKVGDFSSYVDLTAAFPNFYRYNENREDASNNDATGWEAYTASSATLDILKGYALNFGNSLITPKTVEITGTVNNGNYQITLYNNNRKYTDGFNLVGNPYPSPIDWNAAGWTKTNIDDALYFFTAGNTDQYTGTYSSYIGTTSSDGMSSNIIPSMQGFFVRVTNPGNATLGVTNQVRITNYTQEFLKVSEPEKAGLIRISAGFENEEKADPAVIYFPSFAKLTFEKDKDALKLMNTDVTVPNLYSLTSENEKLSINALPKPGSGDVKKIPLGLKTEKEGWMSIGLQDLQNLPSNFNVYLVDSEKRIGQNLSRKAQYRFYAKSGQHDSRFHLMFSETELSDPAMAFDEAFSVKTVDGKVLVSMNLKPGQSGVLLASTITGQILDRKNVSEKETIEIEGIKSSGLYFFSINLKDGMFSKKVLIQK